MGLKKGFFTGKEGVACWASWESSGKKALFPPVAHWVLEEGRWWPLGYFGPTSHCCLRSEVFVGQQHNRLLCFSVDNISLRVSFPKSLKAGSGTCGVELLMGSGEAWCHLTHGCFPGAGHPKIQSCKARAPLNSIHNVLRAWKCCWALMLGGCILFSERVFVALTFRATVRVPHVPQQSLVFSKGHFRAVFSARAIWHRAQPGAISLSPEPGCARLKKSLLNLTLNLFSEASLVLFST